MMKRWQKNGFDLLHRQPTAWIILAVAFGVTLFVWSMTDQVVRELARDRMAYRVEEAHLAIDKRMLEYEQVLRGGAGLFDAVEDVSRSMWRDYVNRLRIETYWPGIQGIGFSLMIPADKREEHIRQICAEGFPGYGIQPDGERNTYSAIIYLEPFRDRNLRAFGYDMFSEPVRREAMERARDSGESAVSGKVTLVQETTSDVQAGFLMYVPVYRPGMPAATVEERQAAIKGFVYSPFRVKDLMRGILGHGVPALDFELFDGPEPSPEHLLFASGEFADEASRPRFRITRQVELPGRVWTVRFQSRPEFEAEVESQQPMVMLLMGTLTSLLLFGIFRALARRQEDILREARRIGMELHQVEARYQRMVENIEEVIFQIDAAGCWRFLNPAWEAVSGFAVAETLGRRFADFVRPDERPRLLGQFQELVKKETDAVREEACGIHRSGEEVWVELYASVMTDEQGRVAGIFGTLRDISARRKTELALRRAREAAETANRAKSEFLANMSHELRTPLNSMLILARLMSADRALTPDQRESAQVIHESGTDLLRLINEILDLSKIEAGRMEVVAEAMRFDDFLDAMSRQFRPVVLARGLEWRTELEDGLPANLITDWIKVEHIVRNLLSNAAKFTARGSVALRIHRPALPQAGRIALSVTDTGIGIPDDKKELIFETFRQADSATSRKYGGTGLGLAIVRHYSRMLGGAVTLESRLDEGSTFTLLLPEEFPHADKIRSGTPLDTVLPVAEFRNPLVTVLVVDDDARNCLALGKILQGRVGRVLAAGDGEEAVRMLHDQPEIHLVLMDIMMPRMDGYQAMEAIRRLPRFAKLPIIALTAKAMPGDRERCLAAGASDYLSKPVQVERLFALLTEWLGSVGLGDLAPERQEWMALPASEGPSVDSGAQLLCNGHPATLLLVDDDVRGNFSLARSLQDRAGRILMATDGLSTMRLMRAYPEIDLVVMDLLMPGMDGFATIARIRGDPRLRNTPILALTALAMPGDERRCLDAGADDYLSKPVNPEQLFGKMVALLSTGSGRADGREARNVMA
ncbi:MAG: CHASE domain-containing protein [Magnetococcales bacterium]|nr:CHASE domain-containing protein [Magnetococcales bacterium]